MNSEWYASPRVAGHELDEMFAWIDEHNLDIVCQGIMQGTPDNPDDLNWHSIWGFGPNQEKLLFILRFSS